MKRLIPRGAVLTTAILAAATSGLAQTPPPLRNMSPPAGDPTGGPSHPCISREPTVLDQRPDWVCVGLATFADAVEEPQARYYAPEVDIPGEVEEDYAIAVSPDGRLYVQIAPSPVRAVRTVVPFNPDGEEEDPEVVVGGPQQTSTGLGGPLNPMRNDDGGEVARSVFGSDNREIRTATTSYPWRTFGAILPSGSDTGNCSGVLVGPRHVLTAGHCIHDGNWIGNLKFGPGMRGVGTFPNGVKNRSWYYSVGGWTDSEKPSYDYGMIILEDRVSTTSLGWIGFKDHDFWGGHWTFGYPGWQGTCAASPMTATPQRCLNYLYGASGSTDAVLWGQITFTTDIQPGQSGSPVYKYNGGDRRAIGIVAYENDSYNLATKIRDAVFDNICDWIGNHKDSQGLQHDCY